MEGQRPNQELLKFLKSIRAKAAEQMNVLFGPVISIPPAIFLAYFGTDMDLGLAILLSIVIAIGTWLLLLLILSLAKPMPCSTCSCRYAPGSFGHAAFNNDRVIQIQRVASADLQATIDYQADLMSAINSTPAPVSLKEEITNVIGSYFELLSDNDIDTAWNAHLTGDIQQTVVELHTRKS